MYVAEMAERLDIMFSVKLGGVRSKLEVAGGSHHTTNCDTAKFNLSLDDNIYI